MTSIGNYTFFNCSGLTSVTIPNSVTSIEEGAFDRCSGLTSVTIPNSVTSIGEYAFSDCYKMTALSLSENLAIVRRRAFMYCSSLKELIIPAKVEFIYQEAFAVCSGLESIKVLATTPPFAYDNTFSKYNIPLYVPEESVSAYQAANPWSKFASFKTLTGDDVTPKVCSKPTISYADGQIVFDCETEGVEYQSSITDSDIKSYTSATIQLSATYTITVVATKSGYQNSEPATATLLWTGATLEEGTNPTRIAEPQGRPILIQSNNGTLTITGTEAGTPVSVYDTAGRQLATATASGTTTTITLPAYSLVIVKIGEKSVKVAISNR